MNAIASTEFQNKKNHALSSLGDIVSYIANVNGYTISQFADILNVSCSTLSRIIQGQSSGSDELIDAISNHIPKDCPISKGHLYSAYQSTRYSRQKPSMEQNRNTFIIDEARATKAIMDGLINRGFQVHVAGENNGYRFYPILSTDALSPEKKEFQTWAFDYKSISDSVSELDKLPTASRQLALLVGYLHVFGEQKLDRISLVVSRKSDFDIFVKLSKFTQKIDEVISVVFVNLENGEIAEHFFPTKSMTRLFLVSPFSLPITKKETAELFW